MNKRGQIETIIGVFVILGLLVAGVYSSNELLSEHRYVGDKSKNISYDLSKCIVNIPEKDLVIFQNGKEAMNNGYEMEQCS